MIDLLRLKHMFLNGIVFHTVCYFNSFVILNCLEQKLFSSKVIPRLRFLTTKIIDHAFSISHWGGGAVQF